MDNRPGRGSTKQTGLGLVAQLLTWGGVLLLLVGGLLAYPYVRSRLAAPPPTPTATVSSLPPTAPAPTLTNAAPTNTPSPSPSPFPTPPTPTATPIPSPTPLPALPSRIVIPTIHVDAPVVPVSWQTAEVGGQTQAAWEVPDMYAAGWHETSAPLGVPGNTVLNGHNTTNGEVFRDLYTLEVGDSITVYAGDAPYTYTVTEILILPEGGQPMEVRIKNARYILPTDDERLTLVTCHPYGSLRNRLIVIAHPQE
ncbi:MAG TPA: sortase [Anaerolineae bacterium]|nr:sortase [Anaerolineae bacterium]